MNQEGQKSNTGAGSALLILGVFFFFGLIFMWNYRHNDIVYLWLRFDRLLALPIRGLFSNVDESISLLKAMYKHINLVTFSEMLQITSAICFYYVPFALIAPIYGAYRAWKQPLKKLTITHTAETLLHRLNTVFPYTTPILNKNLVFDNDPKWKPALKPYQYAMRHGILKDRVFYKQKAVEVLQKQVGRKFSSIKNLKPYEKALMAVFMAKINKDLSGAQEVLEELSRSCASTKNNEPDYSCAYDLFNKHKNQVTLFLRVNKYVKTMLCSMFDASKIRGKLSPSMFLWLKPVDRTLWYALNRIGASTPFVEALGVWDCLLAEQVAFTGHLPIKDWVEYFTDDAVTGKQVWLQSTPCYELSELWVENAVDSLRESLIESGLIDTK